MNAGAPGVSSPGDQEKIWATRVRLNACLNKLIDKVVVGPDEIAVTPKGAQPEPDMAREVARDGSFTFATD